MTAHIGAGCQHKAHATAEETAEMCAVEQCGLTGIDARSIVVGTEVAGHTRQPQPPPSVGCLLACHPSSACSFGLAHITHVALRFTTPVSAPIRGVKSASLGLIVLLVAITVTCTQQG